MSQQKLRRKNHFPNPDSSFFSLFHFNPRCMVSGFTHTRRNQKKRISFPSTERKPKTFGDTKLQSLSLSHSHSSLPERTPPPWSVKVSKYSQETPSEMEKERASVRLEAFPPSSSSFQSPSATVCAPELLFELRF